MKKIMRKVTVLLTTAALALGMSACAAQGGRRICHNLQGRDM